MNILAIETTEKFGSAALLRDNQVIAETTLPKDRRSSQSLHPALQTLFETARLIPGEIDIVAVVAGPGSFTGLRVGITAAKVFAYTVGARIIALDTFQTVAAGLPSSLFSANQSVSVGVDAQRGEVTAAVLQKTPEGKLITVNGPALISVADWHQHAALFPGVLFTGPALERWGNQIPPHLTAAEKSYWYPNAATTGQLAAKLADANHFDDIWKLQPIYSRISAAEEKRNRGIG